MLNHGARTLVRGEAMLIQNWRYFSLELSVIYAHLFQRAIIEGCYPWKKQAVKPQGKDPLPKSMRRLRPVTLTAVKTLQRFIKPHLAKARSNDKDPLQFAYETGLFVTDALVHSQDFIGRTFETTPPSSARVLPLDLSSAFDTMKHRRIVSRYIALRASIWLIRLIIAFLCGRIRIVIIDGVLSRERRIVNGSAQGELLSGDFLNALTDPVRIKTKSCLALKYSDDSFIHAKVSCLADFLSIDLIISYDELTEIVFDFSVGERITKN
eukprot:Lithocolla_globosa_v1_NODE_136_length_5835_cov_11.826644.p2 type:complete len:267 gc:universal NODE_136_length_5835_cov_11.826644:3913-3113(-)